MGVSGVGNALKNIENNLRLFNQQSKYNAINKKHYRCYSSQPNYSHLLLYNFITYR